MLKIRPEVLELVKPGKKVRLFYGENNANNKLCHVRAIVDEEWVVYRVWKGHWVYDVGWMYGFQLAWEDGHLRAAS